MHITLLSLILAADLPGASLQEERRVLAETSSGTPRWIWFTMGGFAALDREGWLCEGTRSAGTSGPLTCFPPATVAIRGALARQGNGVALVQAAKESSAELLTTAWSFVGGQPDIGGPGCGEELDVLRFPRGFGDVAVGVDGTTWYFGLDSDHVLAQLPDGTAQVRYTREIAKSLGSAYDALCGLAPTPIASTTIALLIQETVALSVSPNDQRIQMPSAQSTASEAKRSIFRRERQ